MTNSNTFGFRSNRGEKYFWRRIVTVFLEKMMLCGPDDIESQLVCQNSLVYRFMKGTVFSILVPWLWDLDFIKNSKFHSKTL